MGWSDLIYWIQNGINTKWIYPFSNRYMLSMQRVTFCARPVTFDKNLYYILHPRLTDIDISYLPGMFTLYDISGSWSLMAYFIRHMRDCYTSMALCTTAVTPLLTHWSYRSLALSYQHSSPRLHVHVLYPRCQIGTYLSPGRLIFYDFYSYVHYRIRKYIIYIRNKSSDYQVIILTLLMMREIIQTRYLRST